MNDIDRIIKLTGDLAEANEKLAALRAENDRLKAEAKHEPKRPLTLTDRGAGDGYATDEDEDSGHWYTGHWWVESERGFG